MALAVVFPPVMLPVVTAVALGEDGIVVAAEGMSLVHLVDLGLAHRRRAVGAELQVGEVTGVNTTPIFEALEAGGKGSVAVAVACAMAGIIAGCITATGLASKLISAVVSISNQVTILNPVLVAMFLTMLCCIVLGMGVPTTANYCIMASTCAPILIQMGVPDIAAHFFVFYFGIVADITPPVALAAYAGSAIAGSNPLKTGVVATRLAIAAFIIPYIFTVKISTV